MPHKNRNFYTANCGVRVLFGPLQSMPSMSIEMPSSSNRRQSNSLLGLRSRDGRYFANCSDEPRLSSGPVACSSFRRPPLSRNDNATMASPAKKSGNEDQENSDWREKPFVMRMPPTMGPAIEPMRPIPNAQPAPVPRIAVG